jgi:hypothetical protein
MSWRRRYVGTKPSIRKLVDIDFVCALMAEVLSNFWLLTGVSYAVPLSPTTLLTKVSNSELVAIFWSRISSPPPGVSHTGCTVSVVLNDVKPYQKIVALGHGGKGDYSVWHYNITPKHASLKLGQNKGRPRYLA